MKQQQAKMDLRRLAELVGGELVGDGGMPVVGMAPLETAGPDQAAFLANPRYEKYMAATRAAGVIVPATYAGSTRAALIRCADPYLAFRQAMVALHGFRPRPFVGVHRRACVDQRATLEEGVAVGQFVTVSEGASVGAGTILYPGVFIGPHARVGRECVLHPNVVVYDRCILSDRVTVHANAVIGEDGFGYATRDGRHEKIPQAGWVEIGDDVEIGAGCAIDRATIGATRVGQGSKFSNLVAIGHGAQVGRHNLLVAQVGIAGSTRTGDYCVFGGQAGVVGHLTLGDGVQVAAQAGVTRDLPGGTTVIGSPADVISEGRRQAILVRKLPELRQRLTAMEAELARLKARLDDTREPPEDPHARR